MDGWIGVVVVVGGAIMWIITSVILDSMRFKAYNLSVQFLHSMNPMILMRQPRVHFRLSNECVCVYECQVGQLEPEVSNMLSCCWLAGRIVLYN